MHNRAHMMSMNVNTPAVVSAVLGWMNISNTGPIYQYRAWNPLELSAIKNTQLTV